MRVRELAAVAARVVSGAGEERSSSVFAHMTATNLSSSATPTYDGAQAHAAVYACIDLLVRLTVWQMPVSMYREMAGVETEIPSPTVIANPHPWPQMSASHWRASALESALLRGYAAGLVTAVDANGWPAQILPVHPDDVTWSDLRAKMSTPVEWRVCGQPAELWQTGGDLWIAPGLRVRPGSPVGMSALAYAAHQIALGLGATKFGKGFFDNASTPSGVLSLDVPTLSPDQIADVKRSFKQAAQGRDLVVMNSTASYQSVAVAPEDSQFLDTISANVAMVCMFFGIPPESIGGSSGDQLTYANVEGRNLALLTNTVGAWMQWFEETLALLTPRGQRVELDPEALLRTSVPTLYATATGAVGKTGQPGVLTVNEARDLLGYGPQPDADTLMVPAATAPQPAAPDQPDMPQPDMPADPTMNGAVHA